MINFAANANNVNNGTYPIITLVFFVLFFVSFVVKKFH